MLTYTEMLTYRGAPETPKDFDAYWDEAVAETLTDGDEFTCTPIDSAIENADCYALRFRGLGNVEIVCAYAVPRGFQTGPIICMFPGYNGSSPTDSVLTYFGYLEKFIACGLPATFMAARGQFAEAANPLTVPGFQFKHLYLRGLLAEDPRDSYCRGIYTDAAKCVRVLIKLPGITEVYPYGFSQGGDLAVAAAALEPTVKRVVFGGVGSVDCPRYVHNMDYIYANAALTDSLREYFSECDPTHQTEEAIIRRMSYADLLLFAPRIRAAVCNIIGLQDRVCPTAGQLAFYNRLTTKKRLILLCEGGHAPGKEIAELCLQCLLSPSFPDADTQGKGIS